MCKHNLKYHGIQHVPDHKPLILGNCTECGTTGIMDVFICGHCGDEFRENEMSGLYGKDGEPICKDCERRLKYLGI